MITLQGRKISKGKVTAEALVSSEGISFYGGVDPESGKIVESGHPLHGQSIAGKVLVFPRGKGSTVGSYIMYRLSKNGRAPAAIINQECETIIAVGAIISDIPCVDKIDIKKIVSGMQIEVDADNHKVTLYTP